MPWNWKRRIGIGLMYVALLPFSLLFLAFVIFGSVTPWDMREGLSAFRDWVVGSVRGLRECVTG